MQVLRTPDARYSGAVTGLMIGEMEELWNLVALPVRADIRLVAGRVGG
jgi:hypothetical protein